MYRSTLSDGGKGLFWGEHIFSLFTCSLKEQFNGSSAPIILQLCAGGLECGLYSGAEFLEEEKINFLCHNYKGEVGNTIINKIGKTVLPFFLVCNKDTGVTLLL